MIDPTAEYTLTLALEDLVPVLFSTLALWLLAGWLGQRVAAAGPLGRLGAVLVGLGGLAKAGWKILVVVADTAVPVLEGGLFPLIGTGFTFVVAAILAARRSSGDTAAPISWRAPATVAAVAGAAAIALAATAGGDAWTAPYLILAIVGSTATALLLASEARVRGEHLTAGLFLIFLAGMFGLAGLAGIEPQTLKLQWIEQSISTVAQGVFLFAIWRLAIRGAPKSGPAPAEERVAATTN